METTKVINKGYTITVTSWENDGDNYRTKSMTVESKEMAKAISEMCNTVFLSSNNGEGGIGNLMYDQDVHAEEIIIPFMESHPDLYNNENKTDEQLVEICMNINYELMGGSECYYSRICEKCIVTYSPEDINVEEVNFN